MRKVERFRYIGLHFFNFIINLLIRTKITDCSSGFRAFKADLLDEISIERARINNLKNLLNFFNTSDYLKKKQILLSSLNIAYRDISGKIKKNADLIWKRSAWTI